MAEPTVQPAAWIRWGPMVGLVFAVALTLRLAVASQSPVWMHDDGVGYDQVAQSIARGEGFSRNGQPTAVEDPLYPSFLALIYTIAGHNPWAVRVAQSVLNAAACSIVAVMGVWIAGPAVGWLSGLFAACYPSWIKLSCHWLSETLFIPLLVIALALWMAWQRRPRLGWAVATGIVFGLASLTRFGVAALPFVLAWLAWRSARTEEAAVAHARRRHALVMVLAVGLTILPWTVRNWLVFHKLIPISTKIGLDVYASYFPREGKLYGLTPVDETMTTARALYTRDENQGSAFLIAKTARLFREQPGEILRQLVLKVVFFVTPFDWEILGYRVYNLGYSLMIPWAIAGLWLARRRRLAVGSLVAMLAYYSVLTLLTYGSPRLRLPLEPALLTFAAVACVAFVQRVGRWAIALPTLGGWCVVNLLVWLYATNVHGTFKEFFIAVGMW